MHIPHLPPVGSAPRIALDRFGAPVDPGDLVLYHPGGPPPIAKILDIRPDLRPGTSAPGLIMTLQIDVQIPIPAGQPIGALTRIGYLAPAGPVIGSAARPATLQTGVPDLNPDPGPDRQNLDMAPESTTMPQAGPGPRGVQTPDRTPDRLT